MYTITIQNKNANLFGQFQYTKTKSYVKSFFDESTFPRKAVFIQGRLIKVKISLFLEKKQQIDNYEIAHIIIKRPINR